MVPLLKKYNMGSKTKEASQDIITRPKASPGFWLCTLIPMAYLISGLRYPQSSKDFTFIISFMSALGLNLQSACYFIHLNLNISKKLRIPCAFLPGLVTTALFFFGLHQKLVVSLFWGFLLPFVYHFIYIKTLKALPQSFTYGEASIVVQGFVMFVLNAVLQIPSLLEEHPTTHFSEMNAIMMAGLFSLVLASVILYVLPISRNVYVFYPLMIMLLIIVCVIPVTEQPPIVTLLQFVLGDLRRIFLIIFDMGLVGMTISTVHWQLQRTSKASTSVRKIFHLLVTCVFVPGLIYQCTLMYISTGIALTLLVVLEILRILEVPPFVDILTASAQTFVDEKDVGKIVLTPFYLLAGCSLPMWICPNPCSAADTAVGNLIPMMSGVLSIGIGDTAASVIGSRLGKHKIPGSHKSVEGTCAAIICQALAVVALYILGIIKLSSTQLAAVSLAILFTSLLEAITDQVDNLILPLVFYIISSIV